MKHRYSKFLPGFTLICDIVLMNIAYIIVSNSLLFENNTNSHHFIFIANLCWLAISLFTNIYLTPRPLLLRYSIVKFIEVVICNIALTGLVMLLFGQPMSSTSVPPLFYVVFIFVSLVVLHRYLLSHALNYIRRKGYNLRNIIIVGEKEASNSLKKHFSNHPEYGYDIIHDAFDQDLSFYSEHELSDILTKHNPDEIFICYSNLDQTMIDFFIRFGSDTGCSIKLVSQLLLNQNYARVINYDDLPVLQLRSQPPYGKSLTLAKRTFDVVFSSSVIVLSSPLLAAIYVITKYSSKGPAWYKQERIGLNGKPFNIIKFRSMYVDAEYNGPQLAKHGDPRVTPWGKIIRKTRLDELPQFWNVLKGDMSVVGPRPERQHFIDQISVKAPQYRLLQSIKPGITSIGQISYGYAENVDQMCERMQYDLLYLQNISFGADLRLIANTVKVMVQGKGK